MQSVDIPLLLTSFTALAAVVCPVVSTCVTIRSNERLRQSELHFPKVYEAISRLVATFHGLHRQSDHVTYNDCSLEYRLTHIQDAYLSFSSTCFEVMALLPAEIIRCRLSDLLSSLTASGYQVSPDHEALFNQIVADISHELSRSFSKRKLSPNRKRKPRHAEEHRG